MNMVDKNVYLLRTAFSYSSAAFTDTNVLGSDLYAISRRRITGVTQL